MRGLQLSILSSAHNLFFRVTVLPWRCVPVRQLPLPRHAGIQARRKDPTVGPAAQRGQVERRQLGNPRDKILGPKSKSAFVAKSQLE